MLTGYIEHPKEAGRLIRKSVINKEKATTSSLLTLAHKNSRKKRELPRSLYRPSRTRGSNKDLAHARHDEAWVQCLSA